MDGASRGGVSTVLDRTPDWITIREAAFAARVSEQLLLELARAGRIELLSLLPGQDRPGVLLRAADIEAALCQTGDEQVCGGTARPQDLDGGSAPRRMTRRRILVSIGAVIGGTLVPFHALAGSKGSGDKPSGGARGGDKPSGGARGGGKPSGGAGDGDKPSGGAGGGDKPSGGDGGGDEDGLLVIRSVTVEPDPVSAGGETVITIDASPGAGGLSYVVAASEGTLIQDPREPWSWIWRDA